MSTLREGQHMTRLNVPHEQWLEFGTLARRKKRSVAAYLGHLVQKEIGRDASVEGRRSAREGAFEAQPGSEVDESWVPPWEL